jgi:hypothetical protein
MECVKAYTGRNLTLRTIAAASNNDENEKWITPCEWVSDRSRLCKIDKAGLLSTSSFHEWEKFFLRSLSFRERNCLSHFPLLYVSVYMC